MQTIIKTSDQDIITMLCEKNVNGISILYDKYGAAVFGAILNQVNDHQIAEHILEQTFIQVWNNPSIEMRYTNHLLAWMLKIAKAITSQTLARIEINNSAQNATWPQQTVAENTLSLLPLQITLQSGLL